MSAGLDFAGIARAIEGLIDQVLLPIGEKLGFPLNFVISGIAGFVKGVIAQLLA